MSFIKGTNEFLKNIEKISHEITISLFKQLDWENNIKKVITNHAVTDTYYVWKIIFYADTVLVGPGGVVTHTTLLND